MIINIIILFIEIFFSSPCGANGLCINEQPGYICDCVQGYEFDGTTCKGKKERKICLI